MKVLSYLLLGGVQQHPQVKYKIQYDKRAEWILIKGLIEDCQDLDLVHSR